MSALHSQRNCWCGVPHGFVECMALNFDHLETVATAEVLGPLEEDLKEEES